MWPEISRLKRPDSTNQKWCCCRKRKEWKQYWPRQCANWRPTYWMYQIKTMPSVICFFGWSLYYPSNAVKCEDLIRLSLKLSALNSCNHFYCWTLLTNRPSSFFAAFNKICGDKQFPCLVLSTLLCLEKKIAKLDKKLAQSIFPPPLIRTWQKLGGALVWDLGKI